jgi:hypothetical protein
MSIQIMFPVLRPPPKLKPVLKAPIQTPRSGGETLVDRKPCDQASNIWA